MSKVCLGCFKPLDAARLAAGYTQCKDCAPKMRVQGATVYDGKTGGSVDLMTPDTLKNHKLNYKRKGRMSILRRVSPSTN